VTNPYRAMCAELVDDLEMSDWPSKLKEAFRADIARARALLAQPVAEGPSDEEIMELMPQQLRDDLSHAARALAGFDRANIKAAGAMRIILNRHAVDHARAVLAKWGHPTPQPEGSDIHYSWELHDAEGEWQAGGSAITLESVRREGNHYLQTYSQDGPHTLIIYQASTIEEVTND
jgi:hypothetical protein